MAENQNQKNNVLSKNEGLEDLLKSGEIINKEGKRISKKVTKTANPEETTQLNKDDNPAENKNAVKEINIDTDLFRKKFNVSKKEDEKIELKGFEDIFKVTETKDINELINTFNENKKIKQDLETKLIEAVDEAKKVKGQVNSFHNYFKDMEAHPEMNALTIEYTKMIKGEPHDFKGILKTLGNPTIDFTRDIGAYSDLQIVNAFGRKQYSKEEWEELDEETQADKAEIAKSKFNEGRQKIVNANVNFQVQQNKKRENINTSIERSIKKLNDEFKDFGGLRENQIEEVKVMMSGGFLNELYEPDGSYKEDAATKIALATYGKKTIKTMGEMFDKMVSQTSEKSYNKGQNDTLENVLRYGNPNPPENGGGGNASKKKEHPADLLFEKITTDTKSKFASK